MRRRPKTLIVTSALVVALSASGAATAHAGQVRSGAGHDDSNDHETRRELEEAVEALVDDGAVGVAARVESPDLDWHGAAGARELDGAPPAQPKDRFRVGSLTKTMVATLVMQEVEAGTLTLDTAVNDLVPDLFPDHPEITVEHLLSHRSGAQTATDAMLLARIEDPSSWEQFVDAAGQDYTDADYLSAVNSLPWKFEPGTDYNYANAGYVALGVVLEAVTGHDVADLLEERVFDEAGLHRTSYPDEPGTRGPFLVDAIWTGDSADGGIGWVSMDGFDPDVFGASGAVVSTTKDLNDFTEALVTGELVHPELVTEMVTPRSPGTNEYGLGILRAPDPCTEQGEPVEWLYGHEGQTYGTTAIALSSADGTRQVSVGVTGQDLTGSEPLYDINELLEPMLLATC